jgi:hypothetical protein
MSSLTLKAALSCALLSAGFIASSADSSMAGDNHNSKTDLSIAEQGSFSFGGTVITGDNGDTFHGDHGYAQFQIPSKARKYPLVMWHGGGQHARTYESTPDGREGFQSLMLRKGYPVYIVDQPGRGRAGKTTTGVTIPDATPNEANLFTIFRLGVWVPPAQPDWFPGVQFSQDARAVDQYWRQVTPDTSSLGGGASGVGPGAEMSIDAMAKLFDEVGPAVLITHSASGGMGWLTAIKSENVKAVISYEPTVFVYPDDETPPEAGYAPPIAVSRADFDKLSSIPIQIIYGDNIGTELTGIFGIDLWVKSVPAAHSFAASLNANGGDAQVLELPTIGVRGNTHFPFSDLNNVKIADLLGTYLERKHLDRYPSQGGGHGHGHSHGNHGHGHHGHGHGHGHGNGHRR